MHKYVVNYAHLHLFKVEGTHGRENKNTVVRTPMEDASAFHPTRPQRNVDGRIGAAGFFSSKGSG